MGEGVVLKNIALPIAVALAFLACVLFVYGKGKSAGAAEATKALNDYKAEVLAERSVALADAIKRFNEVQNENEKMRQQVKKIERESNERRAALDIALNSLRIVGSSGGSPMSGDSGTAAEPDGTAAECRPSATACEAVTRRAAHDALTVMEWQAFYESVRAR